MLQQLRASVVSTLIITLLFGIGFPAVVWAISRVVFPHQANGSLIEVNGKVVGSDLIGQSFTAPGYFHPRPSANSYAADNSGGTNLGPTSDKLINGVHKKLANGKDDPNNFDGIKDLAAAYRKENSLTDDVALPADAVTRSASGLDPAISPANAELQVNRVAQTRGLTPDKVKELVVGNTEGRQLGFLGEPRVNVLKLNLALDQAAPGKSGATPAK